MTNNEHPAARSPAESVAALAAQLGRIDRVADPVSWATAAYRLGMATAEQPTAQPELALREALGLYDQAAQVLSERRAPVEHARILNAAGSAHRLLGDHATATAFFERATRLLEGRGAEAEEASVLSNLGLVLAEQGRIDDAIATFEQSLVALVGESDAIRRTRLTTMHNLAQAHMGRGSVEGFQAAVGILEEASAAASDVDASMHAGMVDHSLGVAHKALAAIGPSVDEHLDAAIDAFRRSLTVFTSVGFPMHHAIAKHNLGHALASYDDLDSMRRALAAYDDALAIFDPRLHQAHWREAYSNAEALEARLRAIEPGAIRTDHIVSLAGSMADDERLTFVRQRLLPLESLPATHREERLLGHCRAMVKQAPASFVANLRTFMMVLMELPESVLDSALRAQLAAHAELEPHERRAADFVLDDVVQELLFGPQRIRVRDMLEEIGWDRP